MEKRTVLVSGASIAGPALAFWLHRFGFDVTIVERAEELRLGGQNIDVRDEAQKVVQLMGLEDEIRAANTGELGIRFVDVNNHTLAEFPKTNGGFGTAELEILRGDLAQVFFNATKDNIPYIFGDQILALVEDKDKVNVTFKNSTPRSFDLVIAADGIRSSTRKLIFGDEPVIKYIGVYCSYLTIPRIDSDTSWAYWYNAPESRVLNLRPDNVGTTRASFSFLSPEKGYEKLSLQEQKGILKQKFADAGWQAPRLLQGLEESKDVYFDSISQVKAPRWTNGRCAMVGDAAYCPTPMSGMGASLSIVGAYVLAGELSRHQNHQDAFEAYEKLMRPYVEDIQNLPPGVPWLAHPKTKFGIKVFNTVLGIASSKLVKKITKLFDGKGKKEIKERIQLPYYNK
ncbi:MULTISPECIES: FAD-dependent monooxygenase [Sphingobacterium]|uniref:FAD-dependent monooxygenase n=1 Tax=Sphingobacterium kitahiroshimense TaxID=470446 RepID=A0ABV0BQL4_9SPHI|nr:MULTISPECIES: FAD-dependent monooxygenase [Sphingobacterium]MCS3554158.1 2-polyprenyl-6-methoxyphenol hydroxylase-like FAD-dependent oxidoreductase [Sphingobacterium sp. JUb21]MCW2263304.1 2-polyprenyl-6-methoxyphenol hydroxylase-like FAD-dependent oxidoreductase [Sphingobacterium kitahiroshimense]TCR07991.1 2-polyprenyl-6-methoxyphenol hydroxylase-like FAD-dependent oxidoreductase [Sphingobacterium sp. JUb20]TCR11712.1 2-polyprenyl-6-methoxyphenol hydroxylase-like FAD-dependent oxidoreducta